MRHTCFMWLKNHLYNQDHLPQKVIRSAVLEVYMWICCGKCNIDEKYVAASFFLMAAGQMALKRHVSFKRRK